MHIARHKPVTLQLAQCFGQHFLADAADAFLQARETHLAVHVETFDNGQCPFVGDPHQDVAQECLFFGRRVQKIPFIERKRRVVRICGFFWNGFVVGK